MPPKPSGPQDRTPKKFVRKTELCGPLRRGRIGFPQRGLKIPSSVLPNVQGSTYLDSIQSGDESPDRNESR